VPSTQPRYSKEEFARRGDGMYEQEIRPLVEAGNDGKFVATDIETSAYEIDVDELAASDRLLARVPAGCANLAQAHRLPVCAPFWAPPSFERPVITGALTADREAVIRLAVRGPAGQEQQIEAVVDTGFDGWFSLPPALIALLGLPWRRRGRAMLADGSESVFDMYEGTLAWDPAPYGAYNVLWFSDGIQGRQPPTSKSMGSISTKLQRC
jgi:predicted aspartyl protease